MTRHDPTSQPSSELFRLEQQTSLLVVLPHPDDESFSSGGTLARCADAGVPALYLCGTYGDMGRRLRTFVEQGGGLLIVLGQNSTPSSFTGVAADLRLVLQVGLRLRPPRHKVFPARLQLRLELRGVELLRGALHLRAVGRRVGPVGQAVLDRLHAGVVALHGRPVAIEAEETPKSA